METRCSPSIISLFFQLNVNESPERACMLSVPKIAIAGSPLTTYTSISFSFRSPTDTVTVAMPRQSSGSPPAPLGTIVAGLILSFLIGITSETTVQVAPVPTSHLTGWLFTLPLTRISLTNIILLYGSLLHHKLIYIIITPLSKYFVIHCLGIYMARH